MIIQYTILFSLHRLTIEAAVLSSTSGSIRGSSSSAAAVNDSLHSVIGGGDEHRESESHNNSSINGDDDSHRLLQVATDVSMFLDCMISMRAYRYHVIDSLITNFYFYLIATLSLYSL